MDVIVVGIPMLRKLTSWHSRLWWLWKCILWVIISFSIGSALGYVVARHEVQAVAPKAKPVAAKAPSRPVTLGTSTEVEYETESVPYTSTRVDDPSLPKGQTEVRTSGVNGVKTLTYEVSYADGRQTDKRLIHEEITTEPINEVIAVGSYVASSTVTTQPLPEDTSPTDTPQPPDPPCDATDAVSCTP